MIFIKLFFVYLVIKAIWAALRNHAVERAAAADFARRYVPRSATLTVYNPVDRALWREQVRLGQERADEYAARVYREEIERNRKLNEWRWA